MTADNKSQVILEANVEHFFYRQVEDATLNQGLEASPSVRAYLVRLLSHFCHSQNLFETNDQGSALKPLAFMYAEAVQANTLEYRNQSLRRMGDIALFIAGVFPHSLSKSLIDIDYYIAMGGNAYFCLSDTQDEPRRWAAQREVFHELAAKFVALVDILGEVTEEAPFAQQQDLLRMHEIWSKTGSERYGKKLRELGLNLAAENQSTTHH